MKLVVTVSDETKRILEDLADQDGIEPAKRIHKWLRGFIFDPPFQGGSSWAAQASALIQRGEIRATNNQTFTADELRAGAKRFQFPDSLPEDRTALPDEIEIVFGKRIEDVLPNCLAYLDLGSTAEGRRNRTWNDLPSFVDFLIAGKAAEDMSKDAARAAEEEENEIYKEAKKAKRKKDEKSATA